MIFIVGPTASGKSFLGMELARRLNGEIICADSQTIRKGLDIGTAKPSLEDRSEIPHHMIDIIEPYEDFSVNEFKNIAQKTIIEIEERGNTPIIVGGTGLYINALYYDFDLDFDNSNSDYKRELEQKSVEELQEIIKSKNYELPNNENNPRHLIGTILREGSINKNTSPVEGALIYGLMPEDDVLKQRISDRIDLMFKNGFVEEVEKLLDEHGRPENKMDAIGYPIVIEYLDGNKKIEDVKKEFKTGHWQYARRQKSWFKRNDNIIWLNNPQEGLEEIIKQVIQT